MNVTSIVSALQVEFGGSGCSVQDVGRKNLRNLGVPWAGALDSFAFAAVNRLLNNPPESAALEVLLQGPHLRCNTSTIRVALLNFSQAHIIRGSSHLAIRQPWASTVTLEQKDLLVLGTPKGTAYLGVEGGIKSEPVLRSRSTDLRAKFGGVTGHYLQNADILPVAEGLNEQRLNTACPRLPKWFYDRTPIRVMPAPQTRGFVHSATATLTNENWVVSRYADRMGMRLDAQESTHITHKDQLLYLQDQPESEAILPGCVQITPDGQPMILLQDCQTVGGYPKLACVIQADLPRLAHLRAGDTINFAWVSSHQALEALKKRHAELEIWANTFCQIDY